MSSCANCGKGEGCQLKKCSACKMVQYCSADCQKTHRPQHKRECKKRAAEIFDENLFKQPPPNEDCPICFLTMPSLYTGRKYQTCCGKIICSGCIHAVQMMNDSMCPFCRVPMPKSDEEAAENTTKRVEMDDAEAIYNLGCYYHRLGSPQDKSKAVGLFLQAGELGCAESYYNIGNIYANGKGVERDTKKAKHFYEIAAIGGNTHARYFLGILEGNGGNMSIALKHFMIAAGCGDNGSLNKIREFYVNGHATKDDYAKALRAHKAYIDGIKSDQRDEAAAFDSEDYRYH